MNMNEYEIPKSKYLTCKINVEIKGNKNKSSSLRWSTFRTRFLKYFGIMIILYFCFYENSTDRKNSVYKEERGDVQRHMDDEGFTGRHLLSVRLRKITKNSQLIAPGPPEYRRDNCSQMAIDDFPWDGLTRSERQQGWIIIHILIAGYAFWFLAVICNDYFVPVIELICLEWRLPADSLGATLMAAAVASPELLMNCIGTFVTEGDIGIGAVVGSSMFNVLAVPACCGFFVAQATQVDWWSVTRDCALYALAIIMLLLTLSDGRIMWYEALILIVGYVIYMLVITYNDTLVHLARSMISGLKRRSGHMCQRPYREVNQFTPLLQFNDAKNDVFNHRSVYDTMEVAITDCQNQDHFVHPASPWKYNSSDSGIYHFILRWPITFILWISVPDSRKHLHFKYLTLLLSVVWIGVVSYLIAYAITIIGDTLSIPDSIMGLTILSAGMSLPEAVSSVLVTRQEKGSMGISNALSSNIFDILLCLGLPWFVKAYFLPTNTTEPWILLNSNGLMYATIFLLASLVSLFLILLWNHFIINRKMGIACLTMYFVFLTSAVIIEWYFFRSVTKEKCNTR